MNSKEVFRRIVGIFKQHINRETFSLNEAFLYFCIALLNVSTILLKTPLLINDKSYSYFHGNDISVLSIPHGWYKMKTKTTWTEKYRSTDNTKIGKERGNSYPKK